MPQSFPGPGDLLRIPEDEEEEWIDTSLLPPQRDLDELDRHLAEDLFDPASWLYDLEEA